MNVIDAVAKLRREGGRIRRAHWIPGEYVTGSPRYHDCFGYHASYAPGKPSVYRGYGRPTIGDILADDWEWLSDKEVAARAKG